MSRGVYSPERQIRRPHLDGRHVVGEDDVLIVGPLLLPGVNRDPDCEHLPGIYVNNLNQ